jgi:hypothetical protein
MPYIRRSEGGNIIAIGNEPLDGASEQMAPDAPELRSFLEKLDGGNDVFQTSDLKLIRAIEDVIDLLIQKNVICITDLPPAVQNKLMERRSLRCSLNALKLFGDDEQGTI